MGCPESRPTIVHNFSGNDNAWVFSIACSSGSSGVSTDEMINLIKDNLRQHYEKEGLLPKYQEDYDKKVITMQENTVKVFEKMVPAEITKAHIMNWKYIEDGEKGSQTTVIMRIAGDSDDSIVHKVRLNLREGILSNEPVSNMEGRLLKRKDA